MNTILPYLLTLLLFLGTGCFAEAKTATQTGNASVAFITPLAITLNQNANFGSVGVGSATYVLSTSGVVTTNNGQIFSAAGNSPYAASLTIKGSSSHAQSLNIVVSGYTVNKGVTPSGAMCSYNGSAAATCNSLIFLSSPGSAGKTLLIGLTINVDGSQAGGSSATPSFTVNINYN